MGLLFLSVQRSLPVSFTALEGRGKRCGSRGTRAEMTASEGQAFLVESWESFVMVSVVCGVMIWGRWVLGFLKKGTRGLFWGVLGAPLGDLWGRKKCTFEKKNASKNENGQFNRGEYALVRARIHNEYDFGVSKDGYKTIVYLKFIYTLNIDQNLRQNSIRSYSL